MLGQNSSLFFCAHPSVHAKDNLVSAGVCSICEYWRQPAPEFFRPFPPPPAPPPRGRCHFLGEQLRLDECKTCGGSVKIKVFRCAHPAHGETTLNGCASCADFSSATLPA
jgi:hypothetical protein